MSRPRGGRARATRAAACLTLAVGCAGALGARPLAVARPGGTTFHALRAGGRERSFLLHLPPGVRRPVPLLLAFHGHQANANTIEGASGLDAVADRHGWAVAYPNGTGALRFVGLSWNAGTCCGAAERQRVDDVGFARALVDALVAAGVAERPRVYATGFSAGGMLALRLACEPEPIVAGVADVAGAMPDTACQGRVGVPILLMRGAEDDELRADHRELRRRNGHAYAVSFAGAMRYWMRRNGCAREVVRDSSATRVEVGATGCAPGTAVREVVVAGQAHAWPGGRKPWIFSPAPAGGVDASETIVRFFEGGEGKW